MDLVISFRLHSVVWTHWICSEIGVIDLRDSRYEMRNRMYSVNLCDLKKMMQQYVQWWLFKNYTTRGYAIHTWLSLLRELDEVIHHCLFPFLIHMLCPLVVVFVHLIRAHFTKSWWNDMLHFIVSESVCAPSTLCKIPLEATFQIGTNDHNWHRIVST